MKDIKIVRGTRNEKRYAAYDKKTNRLIELTALPFVDFLIVDANNLSEAKHEIKRILKEYGLLKSEYN